MPSTITAPEVSAQTQRIMGLEKEYVLQNYGRYPVVMHRGKGCYLYDTEGNRYLDLLSGIGVNALGHAHPRITKVIREQAGLLLHTSNLYYHEYQGPLAERLANMSGLQRVFFCNSGTEGMEAAIKMIRSHGNHISPEKFEIVSLLDSFHGRTMGALSVTGQEKYRKPFAPMLDGVRFVPRDDIAALEAAVTDKTAGILIETIQGEGGINPVPEPYLRAARELADRHNALLVFDEIQCGVGRTGTYFAYQLADPVILPDICVTAKPLACGLPLGVVISNERAAASIAPGMHGTTFGGNVLSCRVALEFLDILDELMPSIIEVGDYCRRRFNELAQRFPFIKEVRGHGLMLGIELDRPGKQIVAECLNQGLLINCTHDVVLRFLPPFILTKADVDRAIVVLDDVLSREPK